MNKKISILFALVVVLLLPGLVCAQTRLTVGYTGSEWYTGLEAQTESRKLIGFVGYETTAASGLLAVTNENPQLLGYVQIGRETFLGNLKYALGAHAGNPHFYTAALADNKLGVRGEIMRLSGSKAYGAEAEVNLLGAPSFSVKPYLEFRGDTRFKTQLGLGTHPIYLAFVYGFTPNPQIKAELFGTYNIGERLDYGVSFTLADTLKVRHTLNTDNDMTLSLIWDGTDHPFKLGIVWSEDQVQWHVSYALKI